MCNKKPLKGRKKSCKLIYEINWRLDFFWKLRDEESPLFFSKSCLMLILSPEFITSYVFFNKEITPYMHAWPVFGIKTEATSKYKKVIDFYKILKSHLMALIAVWCFIPLCVFPNAWCTFKQTRKTFRSNNEDIGHSTKNVQILVDI